MTTPDVLEAAKPWMQQCGPHDFGILAGSCGCPPDGDPRPIVSRLATEIEELREELGRQRRRAASAERAHEDALRRIWAAEQKVADVEKRLWAARMVKCWTNEDGKRFVFADDLFAAIDPEIAAKVAQGAGELS